MTLEQPFDGNTLHILREAVLAHAAAAGMPDERAADVMTAVHELAANAVRYGGGAGRLLMTFVGGKLICRVRDHGPAGVHGKAPRRRQPGYGIARLQLWPCEPGHGLWLVRQVADTLKVMSGREGSQVTAVFALA